MNIGILGTGFGAYHAELYKKMDSIESITIFGRNEEKLQQLKEKHLIHTTTDINEILTDKKIVLIDVCLPTFLHKHYVIEALKHGKHVFCETPVALTREDALAMQEAEIQYGKNVFINQFIKHEHPYTYLHKLVQTQTLGSLTTLHIKRKTPPLWGDLSLKRITTDLMIHDLDMVAWLLGKPDDIRAAGRNNKQGQSYVHATFTYPNSLVTIEGSSMMPFSHPFTVGYIANFETGTVVYHEDRYKDRNETSFILYTDEKQGELPIKAENCYEKAIQDVVGCIKNGTPTKLSLQQGVESLNLALKLKEKLG